MSDRVPGMRLATALYRAALRAYPPEFRMRHGREMTRLFQERYRDAWAERGVPGVVVHWLSTAWDVARNAPAERARRMAGRGEGGGPGRRTGRTGRTERRGGMEGMLRDVRYALRALARRPGFTAVVVVTVGLAVGADTAIFSVVKGVLLDPLPYDDPEELVLVWGELTNRNVTNFPHHPEDILEYREQATLLEGIAGVFTFQLPVIVEGEPEQVMAGNVTEGFFDVLGVEPHLGRVFTGADHDPGPPVEDPTTAPPLPATAVILSHGYWQRGFGGDPGVLGRSVDVSGSSVEIVGVMPPGFRLLLPPGSGYSNDVDLWVAMRYRTGSFPRQNVFLAGIGRLGEGVTVARAQSQMDGIAERQRERFPVWATSGFELEVVSMHEELTAGVRPVLLALAGAVALLLLIACANVANLLLVRASAREREMAIRSAMGSSRGRLLRQMLVEALVLGLAGGLLGAGLAWGGVRLLLALRPEELPRIDAVALDGGALAFALGVSVLAAAVFGLVPALRASRPRLADWLKERGTSAASGARSLRNGVVVAEVALSLVLLVGAGLMLRSFVELGRVDPGFEPEGVLAFQVSLPFTRYPDPAGRAAFTGELQRRLEALPGVTAASVAFPLPLSGQRANGRYGPEEALADQTLYRQADYRFVLPGYFQAMGTELLAGRTFTDADQADSASVVVVDERLARAMWPDHSPSASGAQDPLGRRFVVRMGPEPTFVEVIGVVEHQRHAGLAEEGQETIFFTDRWAGSFASSWVVRADVPPLGLVDAVRARVREMDPAIPVADVRLLESDVREAMASTRFALTLLAVFAATALVLAAVGLYGVLAWVVRQRTAEIGVRMAFGAEGSRIVRLVVGQGMALAAIGVGLGLLAALGVTRVMESLLVGVSPTDPVTFGGIAAVFLAVAAVACAVPALRAVRVDPAEALRAE